MHFSKQLGLEIISCENGEAVIELNLTDQHLNLRGIAHGGVLCTLLDDTIGWAVISALEPKTVVTTADLTIHFLRPAKLGRLRGVGRVIRRGRRLVVGEGTIYDEAGKEVAHGVGTWAIVNRDNPADKAND